MPNRSSRWTVALSAATLLAATLTWLGSATALPRSPRGQSGGWEQIEIENAPSPRVGHAMVYDAKRQQVVLFGGGPIDRLGEGRPVHETWTWDGKAWTRQYPRQSPSPRHGHTLIYDDRREVVVLFGGQDQDGKFLDDTWEWDGVTWTERRTAIEPAPRADHTMVWDPIRQRALLFGGRTAAAPVNDCWQWDGRSWSRQRTTRTPDPRFGHAMAYDPDRRVMVLFGGGTGGYPALNDTWQWDGQDWEKLEPTRHPPAAQHLAMTYDHAAKTIVLFGGAIIDQQQRGYLRTWTFDGSDWQEHQDLAGPHDRTRAAMATDQVSKKVILFGGLGRRQHFADTWVR